MLKWYILININQELVWKTTKRQNRSENQYNDVPCL